MQGHRSCCPKTSQLYEEQLNKLHCPVVYTKDSVFVPSFREKYPLCYYVRSGKAEGRTMGSQDT